MNGYIAQRNKKDYKIVKKRKLDNKKRKLDNEKKCNSKKKNKKATSTIVIPQISQSIEDGKCVKQSISLLKQTKIPDNESDEVHSANICVVCDRFIIGIQQINWLKSSELADNEKKLSVTSFEDYYRMKLPSTLREQYCIDDDKLLDNLLLSKRSKKSKKGYMCCASCKLSLVRNKTVKGPPRLSIAN